MFTTLEWWIQCWRNSCTAGGLTLLRVEKWITERNWGWNHINCLLDRRGWWRWILTGRASSHCHRGSSFKHSLLNDDDDDAYNKSFLKLETQTHQKYNLSGSVTNHSDQTNANQSHPWKLPHLKARLQTSKLRICAQNIHNVFLKYMCLFYLFVAKCCTRCSLPSSLHCDN